MRDSSLRWFVTLVAFWSTVLLTRILLVWLVALGIIPGIFIGGLHVHHFAIGFALVLVSLVVRNIKKKTSWVLLGVGLGLATDEFLFWTMLRFDYWSLKNLLATVATGTLLAVLYQRHRTREHVDRNVEYLGGRRSHENPAQPQVRVVVPAYNEESHLPLCLAALLNQDFQDFELIVVDNGSTDETPAVATEFGAKVICEGRKGVGHARQAGFLNAKAPSSLPLTRTPSCPETGLLGSSGSFVRTCPWLGWVVSIVFIQGLRSSKLSFPERHIGSGVSTEESQVDGAYRVAIWRFRRRRLSR